MQKYHIDAKEKKVLSYVCKAHAGFILDFSQWISIFVNDKFSILDDYRYGIQGTLPLYYIISFFQVYEVCSERAKFCGANCFEHSVALRAQLDTEALWITGPRKGLHFFLSSLFSLLFVNLVSVSY